MASKKEEAKKEQATSAEANGPIVLEGVCKWVRPSGFTGVPRNTIVVKCDKEFYTIPEGRGCIVGDSVKITVEVVKKAGE